MAAAGFQPVEEFDLFPGYLLAENRRHTENVFICAACGDLNGDHMDDAVVVVLRAKSGEERADNFAVMLNQGNGLFNASVLPLQKGYEIFSHRIENEQFDVDMKLPGKDRKIYHYKLVGTELVEF